MGDIDWSVFEQYPENEIECMCGAVYYSYSKTRATSESFTIVTKTPCPGCGKTQDHVRRASSDWEHQRIG